MKNCCNGDCDQGRACPVRDENDPLWLSAGVMLVCVIGWFGIACAAILVAAFIAKVL